MTVLSVVSVTSQMFTILGLIREEIRVASSDIFGQWLHTEETN